MNPDDGYEKLSAIYTEFGEFCKQRGRVSEADTRAKIIDRILKEVLGWPESTIVRENPVHRGYIDYVLSVTGSRGSVVVEAKREGIAFDIPIKLGKSNTKFLLNKSIKSQHELYAAIEQAQGYCVESAIRHAVVTNGYAWVIFRALRDDIPWREGYAAVFASAGIIKSNFAAFWNLLSFDAIKAGRLDSEFTGIPVVTRSLDRVLDQLRTPDQLLVRNRLHAQLHPVVDRIFGDIAEADQIEVLERCYVHSKTLRVLDEDLKIIIEDSVPRFAHDMGAVDTTPGRYDAGRFGSAVEGALIEPTGSVFLLLGGVGAGKSTFLKRFFRYVRRHFIESKGCWFYVGFLHPPQEAGLEDYVYEAILQQIRDRYDHEQLETREALLEAFSKEIQALHRTILASERLTEADYQRRLNTYLEKWTADQKTYVRALLGAMRRRGKAIVICIDNVDQLSPSYQNQIFLLSQRMANELRSVTIVALREESFYTASIQRTFTAYTDRKFHISSPDFSRLIGTRLRYAREVLAQPEQQLGLILKSGMELDRDSIDYFLHIIQLSLFGRNRNISRFIECISSGNMREALDMFASFLYSGSTDVDKMLRIYAKSGEYNVAFHEFAKSVILGDRRFSVESASKILNVFDCGADRNSSHFTGLRILRVLLDHHSATSAEGRGYVEIMRVLGAFVDTFDNEEDFFRTADRLLSKALIEVDTRATDTISNATYFRITASGWYYLNYLSRSFSYLDLAMQDTPINNARILGSLVSLVKRVDGISDSESTRQEKLELRFKRVDTFLDYLSREEAAERTRFGLESSSSVGRPVVPPIKEQLRKEVKSIKKRLSSLFNSDEEPATPQVPGDLVFPVDSDGVDDSATLDLSL